MKILYLHQYFKFPDEQGGTRSYDLASSFVKKGMKVVILSATSNVKYDNKRRWNVVESEGLNLHYIYLPYENHLSYIRRSLIFFKFLWFSSFHILKIKADVVLATSTPLTIGIPALMKKWLCRTPFIFEVRDVWPEAVIAIGAVKNKVIQNILYWLERLIYKNAAVIVPLSTDMQKSIQRRYPQFKEKASTVITNISEINRFQNKSGLVDLKEIIGFEPVFSVLYAGTFGKVNGIHKVIELAAKTLELEPNLVYILIGDGAEKKMTTRLAKNTNVLNTNVFMVNSVTKNDLPFWYNSISMGSSFVIDVRELWANSANKFFDTLAAGKPILINYGGWQAEIIEEYNIGYVLPQNVTDEDARYFVEYTQNKELHRQQSDNSIELAKRKYSLEQAIAKYMQVLNSVKANIL